MLQDLEVAGELVESVVDDSATVAALRFLGSPTVQINGIDVEPSARTSNQFGYMCRTYTNGPSQEGIPSRQLIRAAIMEACK